MKSTKISSVQSFKRLGLLAGAIAVLSLFQLQAILADGDSGADEVKADFIGVKKCKMCHPKQHKGWKKSKKFSSKVTLASRVP